jgi:hypothetical protein
MSYPQSEDILASTVKEWGHTVEFWWVGFPGERGAKVVKVDEHGMRWTLDIQSTHWVTQKIAAGLLGVSVMTVNKWVREGAFRKPMLRRGVSVISMRELEKVAEARGVFLRRKG